jgi:hypothetical protein
VGHRIDDPENIGLAGVSRYYRARPGDGIAGADANWLRTRPNFQVLVTVVVPDAVEVVHVLSGQEIPAKQLLHDKNVGYSGRYPIYRFIGALHDREDLISGEGFASYKRIKPSRDARSS